MVRVADGGHLTRHRVADDPVSRASDDVPLDGGDLHLPVFPAVLRGSPHRQALWRPSGGRTGLGPEKHRAGHLDGAELPQPLVQHRSHAVRHLAEPLQQLPDDAERQG